MVDEGIQPQVDLSVVVPVFNEEPALQALYEKLTAVLPEITESFEIIFVDDGSTDESAIVLEALHRMDPRVRVIQFRCNLGKSAGLSVGFSASRGDVVVTMDADLQDEPAEIPALLEKLDEGYDLVSGWKYPRLDPITKTWPSALFNGTTQLLTGLRLHDFNCGFKAYRRPVIEEIRIYGELHRYIPALAFWRGFKVGEVKVLHHPRRFGKSKYGIERMPRGFLDLLTVLFLSRYNRRPSHLFGWIGSMTALVGFVIIVYLSVLWLDGVRPIGTRPLLSFGVLFLFMGIQFISFGLLAELVAHMQVPSNEADYPIKRRLG